MKLIRKTLASLVLLLATHSYAMMSSTGVPGEELPKRTTGAIMTGYPWGSITASSEFDGNNALKLILASKPSLKVPSGIVGEDVKLALPPAPGMPASSSTSVPPAAESFNIRAFLFEATDPHYRGKTVAEVIKELRLANWKWKADTISSISGEQYVFDYRDSLDRVHLHIAFGHNPATM